MKKNQPFDPSIKSCTPPRGLVFRIAQRQDVDALTSLMAERNLELPFEKLKSQSEKEVLLNKTDPLYRVFVAELDGKVVGLARHFHSSGLPLEKRKFDSPAGWYGMGILVNSEWRRNGIARFLFQSRISFFREQRVTELFSIVDEQNLASIRMHNEFGFIEVRRAKGFLHIEPESGIGILFRFEIAQPV